MALKPIQDFCFKSINCITVVMYVSI